MAPARMVARGLDVQAQIPPVSSPLNSCGKDAGTRSDDSLTGARVELLDRTNHPPQPPGVVMHPNRPDLRQRNRPGMKLADADPGTAIWSLLLRTRKLSWLHPLRLRFGKPTPRSPRSAYRARPRLRSTAASSKTWEETSFRQESPVTCLVVVPSGATAKTRPAPRWPSSG
jgi:hypothetical protein